MHGLPESQDAAAIWPPSTVDFAEIVRTVGRGEHLSRSLNQSEAEAAMSAILANWAPS